MEAQVPSSAHNSSLAVAIDDKLRTTHPLSPSSADSIRSVSITDSQAPDLKSLKSTHSFFPPSDREGKEFTPSQVEEDGVVAPTVAPTQKISGVTGKGSNLMMKWLPSSTSSLAQPLEQESTPRQAPVHSFKNEGAHSDMLMTPPFTPIKRNEPLHNSQSPQTSHNRASERFHSRGVFMTPPSTIKHEQINANRARTPLTGLSPALRLSSRNANRGTSPNLQDFHYKPTTDSLVHQMSNLSPIESQRPRSASTPMEPNAETNGLVALGRLFTPRSGPPASSNVGLSLDEGPAEIRKRAGTFCSTPSGSFHPLMSDVNSPAASSLFSPLKKSNSPNQFARPAHQSPNFASFPKNSTNFHSGASSPLAFAKAGPYLNLASQRLEDPTTLLFSSSRNPSDFPFNSSKAILSSPVSSMAINTASDRHQRHHTAPAEGSPFAPGGLSQLPTEHQSGRRLDERSISIAVPQTDRPQSKTINLSFRPRSSTMAEAGGNKPQGKGLAASHWKNTGLENEIQEEATDEEFASNRQARNLGGGSATKVNDHPWYNMHSTPTGSSIPGPYSFFPSPMNRPSNWGSAPSVISSRYCKVLGVPPKLLGSMKGIVRVRNAFEAYGDLLDIHVDTLSPVGFILVGFHDVRSTFSILQSGVKALEKTFGSYLKMEPLPRRSVIQLTQDLDNPVLSTNEGALNLRFDDLHGIITEEVLMEYLSRYGDLKALRSLGFSRWFVEWYDDRRASAAQKELITRDFADFQVKVDVPEPDLQSVTEAQYPGAINQSFAGGLSPSVCLLPLTIRPPPTLNPLDQLNNNMLYRHGGDSHAANYPLAWNQPISAPPSALYNLHTSVPLSADSLGRGSMAPISSDIFGSFHDLDQQVISQSSPSSRPRSFPFPGVPPSNVMDLDRIECGSDPRTTCMIKNIPNKITDEMLFNFINEICPRGFDFLYLRMDFKARLNVGYAFINFLSVENVLRFAKSKLGVKWGVFLSEKTVQMCYASIQGKENLIEKFRNSAIMEEEESFRPKIYHSSGPLMGLPEPFPHANDLQRKARSQANAALLVRPPVSPITSIHQ